jgi:hypothetical protein
MGVFARSNYGRCPCDAIYGRCPCEAIVIVMRMVACDVVALVVLSPLFLYILDGAVSRTTLLVVGMPAVLLGNVLCVGIQRYGTHLGLYWRTWTGVLKAAYGIVRKGLEPPRWLRGGRGRRRGSRSVQSGRLSRPDRSRKSKRRRGRQRRQWPQKAQTKTEEHASRRARPVLETSILPPARRQESIFVPAGVLLAVNPVIFASCWGAFWEPFLFLCILERTCFFLGLFCVFWTLAVTELTEQGLK